MDKAITEHGAPAKATWAESTATEKPELGSGKKGSGSYKFKVEMLDYIEHLAYIGATDKDMAEKIGIAPPTFSKWKGTIPGVSEAIEKGRRDAERYWYVSYLNKTKCMSPEELSVILRGGNPDVWSRSTPLWEVVAFRDEVLERSIKDTRTDPLYYVKLNYPEITIRDWQKYILEDLGKEVRQRGFDGSSPVAPILVSVVSGLGIGKTVLAAWIVNWILDTRSGGRVFVTADTSEWFESDLWAEVVKWRSWGLTRDWAEVSPESGSMQVRSVDGEKGGTVIAAEPKKDNTPLFSRKGDPDSVTAYVFDGAANVPEEIYEAAQNGLESGEPFMFLFGKGEKSSGFFYRSHHEDSRKYLRYQLDSRDIEGTDQKYFAKLARRYGENSDTVRVNISGRFAKPVAPSVATDRDEDDLPF